MPFSTLDRSDWPAGRWLLRDPSSKLFYSVGINHVDESNLLHPYAESIHASHYPTHEAFISLARARLESYGFNTLGWTQEYFAGSCDQGGALDRHTSSVDLLHSSGWSQHELRHCRMPYMVQLPVMEVQDWNPNPTYRDLASQMFKSWCKYLARSICSVHKDSEMCVGCFFVDIPRSAPHQSRANFPTLIGLDDDNREARIEEVAKQD